MSVYKKLIEIQKKIKGLSKDSKSHNYGYVSGNKLLSFIKPIMDEQGLILKQEVLSIDNERQDYKTKYGEKSEILSKVMMRFTWIDSETGEKDENLFGANGQNDWEKGLGSALTYAERYFLLKYFHISTDEDDIDNPKRKNEQLKDKELPWIVVNGKEWKGALRKRTELETLKMYFKIRPEDCIAYNKERASIISEMLDESGATELDLY